MSAQAQQIHKHGRPPEQTNSIKATKPHAGDLSTKVSKCEYFQISYIENISESGGSEPGEEHTKNDNVQEDKNESICTSDTWPTPQEATKKPEQHSKASGKVTTSKAGKAHWDDAIFSDDEANRHRNASLGNDLYADTGLGTNAQEKSARLATS